MWQWTSQTGDRPCCDKVHQIVQARDYTFWVHSSSNSSSGPTPSVSGESQLSTDVSIDYSSLMTKDELIVETPRDSNLEFNLGRLTKEMFVLNIFSNNCSPCVHNFHIPADLQSSVSQIPSQTQSSKYKKSDSHQFCDSII